MLEREYRALLTGCEIEHNRRDDAARRPAGCDGELIEVVFNRWFLPSTGDTIKLLHHRAVPHVVAFDRAGAMYSGHVTDGG